MILLFRKKLIIHTPVKFKVIHHHKFHKIPLIIKKHVHYHFNHHGAKHPEKNHYDHFHQDEDISDYNNHHEEETLDYHPDEEDWNHDGSSEDHDHDHDHDYDHDNDDHNDSDYNEGYYDGGYQDHGGGNYNFQHEDYHEFQNFHVNEFNGGEYS